MLVDTYFPKIDDKGRMTIPEKLRKEMINGINGNVIISQGMKGKFLYIYPEKEFQDLLEKLDEIGGEIFKRLIRLILAGVKKVKVDNQGRIVIPACLRQFASLNQNNQKVVVIGQFKHVEIWNEAEWKKYKNIKKTISIKEKNRRIQYRTKSKKEVRNANLDMWDL
ncbi:MAG: hypothetical protein QME57_01520 [Patescibacteria group bacterium]|nr:hypothetical protein [Patescibacteria group bacterium]